jgi:putative adhesin
MNIRFLFTLLAFSAAAGIGRAQTFADDPCRDRGGDRGSERHCEVREESMAAGPLTVDAGPNGGIRIEGWDQNSIRVQAMIQANAREEGRAREIAQSVQILAGNGHVSANGPERDSLGSRESWSVSYRINVPRRNDLDLRANNGGITIRDVSGNIKFDTNNGGVTLADLGGNVRGETHNGGLTVDLAGTRWDGDGIDVETTNGGVTLNIPAAYNAELETRTENGGFRIDFPITVQGELSMHRGIKTTLGAGGPPVRVRTTNGGLRVNRR